MTIEEALHYQIVNTYSVAALMRSRLYPLFIPQDVELPAAAYQRISGPRLLAHDGATGLADARIQVTVTASSYSGAKALANVIRTAVEWTGAPVTWGGSGGVTIYHSHVENEMDGYNQQTGYQTVRLDIILKYEEV